MTFHNLLETYQYIWWNFDQIKQAKHYFWNGNVVIFMPPISSKWRHKPLQWRHNGRDNVSNHQPRDCFLNRLFRRRSKKTSELRVTGLCAGNSPETGEFPAQMASNAENVSIWWRHHAFQWSPRKQSAKCHYSHHFILPVSATSQQYN